MYARCVFIVVRANARVVLQAMALSLSEADASGGAGPPANPPAAGSRSSSRDSAAEERRRVQLEAAERRRQGNRSHLRAQKKFVRCWIACSRGADQLHC